MNGCAQKMKLVRWAGPCVRASHNFPHRAGAPGSQAIRYLLNWLLRGKQDSRWPRHSQLKLHRCDWKDSLLKGWCVFFRYQKPISVSTCQCGDFLLSTSIRDKGKGPLGVECGVCPGSGHCPRLESLPEGRYHSLFSALCRREYVCAVCFFCQCISYKGSWRDNWIVNGFIFWMCW